MSLELIIGPMFSGKTTKLIERYHEIQNQLKINKTNTLRSIVNHITIDTPPIESIDKIFDDKDDNQNYILTINHIIDKQRYPENKIVSHDREEIPCISIENLSNIKISKYTRYILINEAQLFKNLKSWIINLMNTTDINFILCGLDSDYKIGKFGELLDLIPYATSVIKLQGKCSECQNPSLFTHRLTNECEQVVIGTTNYIPVCRKCYVKLNNKIK
tara:strand:+ start:2022 stop:2672 length:651 start_codon:yes stop_codon:yes gene_type:complete